MLEQGATTKKMYFIKSGKIKLFVKHDNGSQQEIAERGSGEVLGAWPPARRPHPPPGAARLPASRVARGAQASCRCCSARRTT